MNGAKILFHFPEKTPHSTINKFMQKFYGQDSTSWKEKYAYHRHGLFYNIPHRKLLRGVIKLRNEYVSRLLEFLGKYTVTHHVGDIKPISDHENLTGETDE
jgi:hypothetical protein